MDEVFKNNMDALVEIKSVLKVLDGKNSTASMGGIPSLEQQQYFAEVANKLEHIKSLLQYEEKELKDIYKPIDKGYRTPTPEEIREEFQGFPGARLAKMLDVNPRTIRKWIGGESKITYSAWRLFLIKRGKVFEDLVL